MTFVPGWTGEVFNRARDLFTAERLVGESFEQGGAIFIPVVSVRGGGGFGGGGTNDPESDSSGVGEGGGFGITGRPVGMYVIKEGRVDWKPALDYTRMFVTGCVTAIALSWIRRR